MSFATRLLSSTIGRVVLRYRTLGDWLVIYRQVIESRQICDKTKANHRSAIAHVAAAFGERTIGSVRPHEVAGFINRLAVDTPQAAKRALFETREIFSEAINYGWVDRNPATPVKPPPAKVRRRRLTLDQWKAIYAWSVANQPPWVSRMLMLALVTGQRRSDLAKMRFSDVWDGFLHIEQAKTGARLALPDALRLGAIGRSIGEVISDCRDYAQGSEFVLRKHNGTSLVLASLSARFEEARDAVIPLTGSGIPPSLHECRSLSERLYRAQGVNTMVLLGHKRQEMTDIYNDDRGLSAGEWKTLAL